MSPETLYLKIATEEDTQEVLSLLSELFYNSFYSNYSTFDFNVVKKRLEEFSGKGRENFVIVLLKQRDKAIGLVIGCKTPQLYNDSTSVATELAFWIKPESRTILGLRLLLAAYFFWAKNAGCTAATYGKLKGRSKREEYKIKVFKNG